MKYFLSREAVLKTLEHPAVYNIRTDELYELDDASFQCYIGDQNRDRGRGGEKDELSLDQIQAVLREFEAMQGLRVLISGGEPLMRSQFEKINEMLPEFQISPAVGGKYLRYGYGEGLHSGTSGLACGAHRMAVMADGKIAKCTFYADRAVGSIADGLRESWQRIEPVRIETLTCDCHYLNECRGGCRYRALLLGDELGKDFYKCHSYDKLCADK